MLRLFRIHYSAKPLQVQTAAGTHTYIEVPAFDPAWDNLWLEARLPWPLGLLLTPRHLDRWGARALAARARFGPLPAAPPPGGGAAPAVPPDSLDLLCATSRRVPPAPLPLSPSLPSPPSSLPPPQPCPAPRKV
jgi:hypothetical protein